MLQRIIGVLFVVGVRLLTGVQARWLGCGPSDMQRIYFANHSSHIDFVLIWSVLPHQLRVKTRPVAALDYWRRGPLRRYLIDRVFRGVLIARGHFERDQNPITSMGAALTEGDSLILFPEGTRGSGEAVQPFKPGILHLAEAYPKVELVPVWIDNAYRVMPKGSALPIPLLCSVAFGKPLARLAGEQRAEFLERLRAAVVELGNT